MRMGTNQNRIIIIDSHHLRRASIMAIVQPWADSLSLELEALSPDKIEALSIDPSELKLIILNVGGASLQELAQEQVMALITERYGDVPCAVLSDLGGADEAITACQCGWKAFVSSDIEPSLVLKALSFVMNGGTYFPLEALLARPSKGDILLENGSARDRHANGEALTRRQAEVLDRLRGGKSNKLIARELQMQESTVKVHVRQIMRKLGATNRTQAALLAQASHDSAQRHGLHDDHIALPVGPAIQLNGAQEARLNGLTHTSS